MLHKLAARNTSASSVDNQSISNKVREGNPTTITFQVSSNYELHSVTHAMNKGMLSSGAFQH